MASQNVHAQLACAVFTHNFGDPGFGGSPINPEDQVNGEECDRCE